MTNSFQKRCIWIIAKYATAREQGFESRTVALARNWVRMGREVIIISSTANHFLRSRPTSLARTNLIFDGVRMVMLRTISYRATASFRRVVSWLHFEWRLFRDSFHDLPQPDVIVVSSLSLFSVLNGFRLSRRFRCPWVFEVRDVWPLTLIEEGGFSTKHPLVAIMTWIERLAYRRANLVVSTMPNLSPHASVVAGKRVTCHCVPFGFDEAHAPPLDALATEPNLRISRNQGSLIVGYAGSMGTSNALDHIVRAAIVLRQDPRFQFVFLGDGDLRATYEGQTNGCPNVRWMGKVARENVHCVLRQCDLLYFAAHPSKVWESGMSLNKVTDYLLAAKPVLASYSGFPSILNEAGCGEFVPAGDLDGLIAALLRFAAKSAAEMAAMGLGGRQWLFEHRSWPHLSARYLDLIDALPQQPSKQERRGFGG